jgi:hypothetical protein
MGRLGWLKVWDSISFVIGTVGVSETSSSRYYPNYIVHSSGKCPKCGLFTKKKHEVAGWLEKATWHWVNPMCSRGHLLDSWCSSNIHRPEEIPILTGPKMAKRLIGGVPDEGDEKRRGEVMSTCTHHWQLGSPDGRKAVTGVCKLCGEVRSDFMVGFPDFSYHRSGHKDALGGDNG